jgi:cytochrome c oxidase cbb3-type subunit I/II
MDDPRAITAGSIMPAYPWMLTTELDFERIPAVVQTHRSLGVPYGKAEIASASADARQQANQIATEIFEQGGPAELEDKKIVALIAYLQRLGTDLVKVEPASSGEPPTEEVAETGDESVQAAEEAP